VDPGSHGRARSHRWQRHPPEPYLAGRHRGLQRHPVAHLAAGPGPGLGRPGPAGHGGHGDLRPRDDSHHDRRQCWPRGRHRPHRAVVRPSVRRGFLPHGVGMDRLQVPDRGRPRPPSRDGPEAEPAMKAWVRFAITAVCLVAGLLLLNARSQGHATPLRRPFDDFPTKIGAWTGQEATRLDIETLNILKVSDYVMRRYVDQAGRGLWVYLGYWESQRRGAQMHSPKNCLPGSGWDPLEATVMPLPVEGGRTIHVNRFLVQKSDQRELVLYWYRAQGDDVPGEVAAKAAMVKNAIIRNRTDGALLRVSAAVESSVAETSDRLVAFVQA